MARLSDFHFIKKRIYNEERIEELLEKLDCWGIDTEQRGNLYVAGLPDGDNKRSVQIKNNENLNCSIRSKGIDGDIFDLVAFIIYGSDTKEERKDKLSKSKYWVCTQLSYLEYIDEFYKVTSNRFKQLPKYNEWLDKIKKQRNEIKYECNKPYDAEILKYFGTIPYKKWIDEGINFSTQLEFGVGIDVKSERITFPVHNRHGDIIGVKGRYCGRNEQIENDYKYLYIIPCNKSIEFFNLHRAFPYIDEKKEVIIVEGAKTVMFLYQWGYRNCISIEGDSLSAEQIRILKSLGVGTKYVFAWDKDKEVNFIINQTRDLFGRLKYGIYDKDNLLCDKDSPADKGRSVWEKLYNENNYLLKG